MTSIKTEYKPYLLITIMGLLFFLPYLGLVHLFDWDEINFAEAAREMIVTGDYLTVRIDYEPFHEKPPLFIWLQALSMNLFGINEFAARLPNAVTGVFTLITLYHIGRRIFDEKFGLLWALAYSGSLLPHFYFKSGLIDPVFNLLIFLSIYYIYKFTRTALLTNNASNKNPIREIYIASLFASLAVLTKGPAAILLILLTFFVFYLYHIKKMNFPWREVLVFSGLSILPAFIWYGKDLFTGGGNIAQQFIEYQIRLLTTQEAGHGGPVHYHFIVLLLGCFPSSIIAIRGFRRQVEDTEEQRIFKRWCIMLLCVTLGVFSIVETKIVHYSSLAYPAIAFLAAYSMYSVAYRNAGWKTSTSALLGMLGLLISSALFALPVVLMNTDMYLHKITDEFTKAILMSEVSWGGYEYLIGLFYLAMIITTLLLITRRKFIKGFTILFGSTAITIFVFLPLIAPKIEQYTQSAPIEFFQSLQGKDCYVETLGYKSYAHYFYARKTQEQSAYYLGIPRGQFQEWLLSGDFDKPAFFSAKIKGHEKYLEYPGMSLLYIKNGFVFMKREIHKTGFAVK